MHNNYVTRLKESISKRNAVFVIGSGVSAYSTNEHSCASLVGLLKNALIKSYKLKRIEKRAFEDLAVKLSSKESTCVDYLHAANVIVRSLMIRNDEYSTWIQKVFGAMDVKNRDLVEAIKELGCPVVTTNYDLLLESVLGKSSVTCDDSGHSADAVLHVYGHYKDPLSMVVCEDHFENLLASEFVQLKMKDLMENKTLICVGYSSSVIDVHFKALLKLKQRLCGTKPVAMYKLVQNANHASEKIDDVTIFDDLKTIEFGSTPEELIDFIRNLNSLSVPVEMIDKKSSALKMYLRSVIEEQSKVCVLDAKTSLDKVYVDLVFEDRANSLQNHVVLDEFRRRLLSPDFFTDREKLKIHQVYFELCKKSPQSVKNFIMEKWLDNLLEVGFTRRDAESIRRKINELKKEIIVDSPLASIGLRDIYGQLRDFMVIGEAGSGKTSLVKWLAVSAAKQILGRRHDFVNTKAKLPIFMPALSYTSKMNDTEGRKITLLEFICRNVTVSSKYFKDAEGRELLMEVVIDHLVRGDALIIFDGLDEIGVMEKRVEFIKELNTLISSQPDDGNRFVLTSRVDDVELNVPKVHIKEMSGETLEAFCCTYMKLMRERMIVNRSLSEDFDVNQMYKDVQMNEKVLKIARNPQLAVFLASIYDHKSKELPHRLGDLYEKIIDREISRMQGVNKTAIWSVLQETADYIQTTGALSDEGLKYIVRNSVKDSSPEESSVLEILDSKLLDNSPLQGINFISRGIKDYLIARHIVYSGDERRETEFMIESIKSKLHNLNWHVSLNMAYGILDSSMDDVVAKLLSSENRMVVYLFLDSLADTFVLSQSSVCAIGDFLLADSGVQYYQTMVRHHFKRIKEAHEVTLKEWFMGKFENEDNVAACAWLLFNLKWYDQKFHEILLKNLHNDSSEFNWPVSKLLRLYSSEITDLLKVKQVIEMNNLVQNHPELLRLMVVIYGGYRDYENGSIVREHRELESFLRLTDHQKQLLLPYFEYIWGSEAIMKIQKSLDNQKVEELAPYFESDVIYKDSFITDKIVQLVEGNLTKDEFKHELVEKVTCETSNINDQLDALLALLALSDADFFSVVLNEIDESVKKPFKVRINQLMNSIKDPVSRCSTQMSAYLADLFKTFETQNYRFYFNAILSINSLAGGRPIDPLEIITKEMAVYDISYIQAEYLGSALNISDRSKFTCSADDFYYSFLELRNSVQRNAIEWPVDQFILLPPDVFNTLTVSFLNILENQHSKEFIYWINGLFINEAFYQSNPDIIPIMVMLNFTVWSSDMLKTLSGTLLIDGLFSEKNLKQVMLNKIEAISNPYLKTIGFCQLALYYETKSFDLFTKALKLAKEFDHPYGKFHLLELIYSNLMYKEYTERKQKFRKDGIFKDILQEMQKLVGNMGDSYGEMIIALRLAFYFDGEMRLSCFKHVLSLLAKYKESHAKHSLIMSLKPIIGLFSSLEPQLTEIIDSLKNTIARCYLKSNYGRILSTLPRHQNPDHVNIETLVTLYGQLHDVGKQLEGENDPWKNLFNNPDDQVAVLTLIKSEIVLTPQAALVIDDIIHRKNKENSISVLFPYLVSPSNEILPLLHQWMNNRENVPIQSIAFLLLAEHRHLFSAAVPVLTNLLKSDNDRMRLRAQKVFQAPGKRASVIGESTIFKIFENIVTHKHVPRVRPYLEAFFDTLVWDDPEVFVNLVKEITMLKSSNKKCFFMSYVQFMNRKTWTALLESLNSISYGSFYEECFIAAMKLAFNGQLGSEDWIEFVRILSFKDINSFETKLYFTETESDLAKFLVEEIHSFVEMEKAKKSRKSIKDHIEGIIVREKMISVADILTLDLESVKQIAYYNFYSASGKLDTLGSTEFEFFEAALRWLMQDLKDFTGYNDSSYNIKIVNLLLALTVTLAQRDDMQYRKIANSSMFNKTVFIKLLEKSLNNHPAFEARENSLLLLAMLDRPEYPVILTAFNSLLDEGHLKKSTIYTLTMLQIEEAMLKLLKSKSDVKIFKVFKILSQFLFHKTLDTEKRSKIIDYLNDEVEKMRDVCFYSSSLPLKNEFYKTLLKLQGVSLHVDPRGWERFRLCEYDVDDNTPDTSHADELSLAKQPEIVQLLIDMNVDVNKRKDDGMTPLIEAVLNKDAKVVQVLIENNADVNARDSNGATALIHVCDKGKSKIEIIKLLLENGADVNAKDNRGYSALLKASKDAYKDIIQLLIEYNADVNAKEDGGMSSLMLTSNAEVAQLLIDYNANVNEKSGELSVTPLISAIVREKPEMVEILVENKADVNAMGKTMSALMHAIQKGNIDVVGYLIDNGALVNEPNQEGYTPFMAIASDDVELAKLLIECGADVNAKNENGISVLTLAVQNGFPNITKLLIENEAEVNVAGSSESAPIIYALTRKHEDVAKILIDYGADVNAKVAEGTPLMNACQERDLTFARLLIANRADVNAKSDDGLTPLIRACENGDKEMVELLLQNNADVNAVAIDNELNEFTALMVAVQSNNTEITKLLLEHNANVDARDSLGETSLIKASGFGLLDMARILIENNADLNAKRNNGYTPLHSAAAKGHRDIVEYLISHSTDVDVEDDDGMTPLMLASINGYVDIVRLLIDHDADINKMNNREATALLLACENGHLEIVRILMENDKREESSNPLWLIGACYEGHESVVRYLVERGVDINAKSKEGWSPLMYALRNGNENIIKILLENKANVDLTTPSGGTALNEACLRGEIRLVKFLLESNVDVNAKSEDGSTALMTACSNGQVEIVKILIDHNANVNERVNKGRTALTCAYDYKSIDCIRILAENNNYPKHTMIVLSYCS